MRNSYPVRVMAILLLALLLPGTLSALSSDRNKPIHIEADRAEYDRQSGTSNYWGNVRLTQGSLVITADRLRIDMSDDEVTRMVAHGNPATLRQLTDKGKEVKGEAQEMEFRAQDDEVILKEQARVWQENNQLTGKRIVYNVGTGQVVAGGQRGERVRVTIQPEGAEEGGSGTP